MRTLGLLVLLGLLLLNVFGFYVAFVVRQDTVQKEMSELVNGDKKIVHQSVTLSRHAFEKLVWTTEGKEFRFDGKLYDVSKIEFGKDIVRVFVEEDSLEANLINDFISTLSAQTEKEQSNSPLKLLLEHFLKEFLITKETLVFQTTVSSVSITEKESFFLSYIANRQSPPPDRAC